MTDHSVLCSSQDHLETGTRDHDHPILVGAKNIDSWHARMGDLQHGFLLDVPMVPSYVITIAVDGEHLTCGGFSLCETIHLGNFYFIADYFGGLSLSPRWGNSSTAFMGSTHSGASCLRRAMIEDSAKELLTTSSRDGGFCLPFPRRHDMGALLAPIATTPWLKGILDIAFAQQVESSLQHRAKASVSSPWDFSKNQLSHIPNSIFF
jgi:hypothetical protein